MKCNKEYYRAVLRFDDYGHNRYRIYECNDLFICEAKFEEMLGRIKGSEKFRKDPKYKFWTLTLEKHCSPIHIQIIKIRSSDKNKDVDSPLY